MNDLFVPDADMTSYVIKDPIPAIEVDCAASVSVVFACRTLAWDEIAADEFAEVRAEPERGGTPIGVMDTMIAAHAKSIGAILVTDNVKHFQKVKGLNVENWAR